MTDEEVRDAVAGVLDAYLGDLVAWGLLLALLGVVVAGAAAALDPGDVKAPAAAAASATNSSVRAPSRDACCVASPCSRSAWLSCSRRRSRCRSRPSPEAPTSCSSASPSCSCCCSGATRRRPRARRTRRRALIGAGVAAAVAVAALLVALVVADHQRASPDSRGCRDSREGLQRLAGALRPAAQRGGLRRHPQRVLRRPTARAGTSPTSAARSTRQLRGRHPPVPDRPALGRGGRQRPRADRLRHEGARPQQGGQGACRRTCWRPRSGWSAGSGSGDATGERDVFLCHTVCELGATRMVDALVTIPGVPRGQPRRGRDPVHRAVREAERDREALRGGRARCPTWPSCRATSRCPTLGELVDSDRRVIVFSREGRRRDPALVPRRLLVRPGHAARRDQRVSELRCRRERGDADSPLLMLNHWADLFPPRLRANRPFLTERVLLERAHRCARQARPAGRADRRRLLRPGRPGRGGRRAQRGAREGRPGARRG